MTPLNDVSPSLTRSWATVLVLTLAYTISFVDRMIISLLVEPIRLELGLSDTQLSLLQGLAFSIFYSAMMLPFGWLADSASRKWIVAAASAVWCLSTAACGLAGSFWQLFLARIGVGAGEAPLSPAAVSMIGDCFPPEKRSLPLGVYVSAASAGSGLALICGGAVIQVVARSPVVELPVFGAVRSWQATFIIVGLGGLIVPLLAAALSEPRRRVPAPTTGLHASGVTLVRCLSAHRRFFLCQYTAIALYCAVAFGLLAWTPAFFMRRFDWTAAETGLRFGSGILIAGGSGAIAGGALASWARGKGLATANIDIALPAMVLVGPLMLAGFQSPDADVALVLLAVGWAAYTVPNGLMIGAIQDVTPPRLQGQTAALYYLVIGVLGLTMGPLLVALLTDYVFLRPEDVGISLSVLAGLLGPFSAFVMFMGRSAFTAAVRTG
ncbi:MFStransporter [Skermanella stibiiresistens SB22]|uniref:MFStransporter n=1 Tax=Skermanella stibiiresistens SB22 TaxID=1385369 RepID=W9GUP4_9PROT|nr:MFS transporter [Skermanella stibiiresistens]EWY36137.1 MFStransporter [Skermanella stibiiresistens SB22]